MRTGKSTFIKRFMETLVLPKYRKRDHARPAPPTSCAPILGGKTIMTTEPKFIPEEAVQIKLDDNANMNVSDDRLRGLHRPERFGLYRKRSSPHGATPWYCEDIPFPMAAEIGTRKVINDHSSIGLVLTSDGSITDIPRSEYEEVEERVISELGELGKPFAVLLNMRKPEHIRRRSSPPKWRRSTRCRSLPPTLP